MAKITGITANTPKHLLLDAGAFIKNYDTSATLASNMANVIGATDGGGTFSAVPTVHNVTLDGAPTHVKGLERVDEWVVTFGANVKEHTVDTLSLALGAADTESETVGTTSESAANYTKITGKPDIEAGDYIGNITWVGRLSGSDKPVIIVMKNALSINGLSLAVADKSEAGASITITAHYDISDLEAAPFEIHYPTIA